MCYHVFIVLDGERLCLELLHLFVVGVFGDVQVVHGQRPEGRVELGAARGEQKEPVTTYTRYNAQLSSPFKNLLFLNNTFCFSTL